MSYAKHTPGPYIVRGEIEAGLPGYAMGTDPAPEDGTAPRNCGWPYFIREDREFATGSGPLWLAHGIQRKADADLFAAAPDMLEALAEITRLVNEYGHAADVAKRCREIAETAIAKAEGKL